MKWTLYTLLFLVLLKGLQTDTHVAVCNGICNEPGRPKRYCYDNGHGNCTCSCVGRDTQCHSLTRQNCSSKINCQDGDEVCLCRCESQ
uniref:Putative dermacentor 9 kDa family member n=1 Tax=Rhipicephalus pulchellus TaxID=72859 RepID=L7MCE0_RHIPC